MERVPGGAAIRLTKPTATIERTRLKHDGMQGVRANQSQGILFNGGGEDLVVLTESTLIHFGRRQVVLDDQNRLGSFNIGTCYKVTQTKPQRFPVRSVAAK